MFSSRSPNPNLVQHLHQRTQAVAVRCNEDVRPACSSGAMREVQYGRTRANVSLSDSEDGISRAARRHSACRSADSADRKGRAAAAGCVAATPDPHLLAPCFSTVCVLLSPAGPVVALVQPPRALDRQPHQVHLVERDPQRADRALQQRRERHVEGDALGLEQLAGLAASTRPCPERSMSIQPVKRFSRFQMLWPWRSSTSLPVVMVTRVVVGAVLIATRCRRNQTESRDRHDGKCWSRPASSGFVPSRRCLPARPIGGRELRMPGHGQGKRDG